MTPAHIPLPHPSRRATAHRPRYLPTKGCWTEPEPVSFRRGLVLIFLGVAASLSFFFWGGAADGSNPASLLVVLGGAFCTIGTAMLCCTAGGNLARRITRIKKHCGCCRFYQAAPGDYAQGRCQADPSSALVRRTDGCPSFCHSPRAMVRDRLSQHPEMLAQLRVIQPSEKRSL
ncbi:MAG TPA: hypothetical protein VH540_05875 [Ktedonobacterales bacterium]